MSLTGNYEAAFELSEQVVRDIFAEAYRSGEIPYDVPIDDAFGAYTLSGHVNIREANVAASLGVSFTSAVTNGIKMTLPLDIEAQVLNSPAPSINPIRFSAGLDITAPVQALPDASNNKELALNLSGLPDAQIQVNMPVGPVVAITAALVEDGLHQAYRDGKIPHSTTYGTIQIDVLDDDADASRQIHFTVDSATSGTMTLPLFIHVAQGFYESVTIHHIVLDTGADSVTFRFNSVTAADIETSALLTPYRALIAGMVATYPPYPVPVPSNATIAAMIRTRVRAQLGTWGADGNGRLHLYTPNAVENLPIDIVDFTPSVKPGFLAVLFNPMAGADPTAVDNFIPTGKKFAQALSEPKFQEMVDVTLKEQILDANGCSDWPCTFNHEIEGHEVTLTSKPTFTLQSGYIQMHGEASVSVDCWFDPDVDYEAKATFHFETDGDGNKTIKPDLYDEDVDLDCLSWFLGFIIPIYGWIALGVANSVIESVGGGIVHSEGEDIASGTRFLAGEIHGVGGVTTMLDQIDISPEGIILSGGTFVVSSSQPLTYVPADSGQPFTGWVAAPVAFGAKYLHPKADYAWKVGDGGTATSASVFHTYGHPGVYLATLDEHINLARGALTHHLARIRVKNVQPKVNAGANITVNEGAATHFLAHFTNPEYTDTHDAAWLWGDGSHAKGAVAETHAQPVMHGTVKGTHAYGDNGTYTVTLGVRDDDGGVGFDTLTVTVLNVPPEVEAGPDVFAYPCMPITLCAAFKDPGWLDTHTGEWFFGDGSLPQPAIIRERHDPPAGVGVAAAAHIYRTLGEFRARCVVVDDDGGIGQDHLVVRVVSVRNAGFEEGFRNRVTGAVANEWAPYVLATATVDPPENVTGAFDGEPTLFGAEDLITHGGQRAQRIGRDGDFKGGILQQVGANPGWEYQIATWYHLDERAGGACRLGVDPGGGDDPTAAGVVWLEGTAHESWKQLVVRVTAVGRRISIFLEAEGDGAGANAWFDDVELLAVPCAPELELPAESENGNAINPRKGAS